MSLARSFLSDPHGMIFIHASCDQPLMNSPITKLSFVILNRCEESYNRTVHGYFAALSMTKTLLSNLDIVTLSFKLNICQPLFLNSLQHSSA